MQTRPVFLTLWQIHFPMSAIVSILHRISGVILFLMIPSLLWLLDLSLKSPESFSKACLYCQSAWVKTLLWFGLSALMYHLLAGIRHLLADLGFGESLRAGSVSAGFTLLLSFLAATCLGVCLWFQ